MATMTVMFEVDAADSGKVMQALAPHMGVLQNFSMEGRGGPRPKRHCVKRGSKVEDTIIACLTKAAENRASVGTLGEALAAAGMSSTSASPGVTGLERKGKVRRTAHGEVELVA